MKTYQTQILKRLAVLGADLGVKLTPSLASAKAGELKPFLGQVLKAGADARLDTLERVGRALGLPVTSLLEPCAVEGFPAPPWVEAYRAEHQARLDDLERRRARRRARGKSGVCPACGKEDLIFARGLCPACYQARRRKGLRGK